MHTYTRMHAHVHMHTHMCVHPPTHACMHMHKYTHTYVHTCICTQPHIYMYICTHTHIQTHTHRMKSLVGRYQQLRRLQDSGGQPREAQSRGCLREAWGAVGTAGVGCSDSTVLARFNPPASSCIINHSSNIYFPCISFIFSVNWGLWQNSVCKKKADRSILIFKTFSDWHPSLLWPTSSSQEGCKPCFAFNSSWERRTPCNQRTMFGRVWASSLRLEARGQSMLAEPWPGSLLGALFS